MSDIDSPCVRNCCLDDDDVCLGCHRTMHEIMEWADASDERKHEIMAEARVREDKRIKERQQKKPPG